MIPFEIAEPATLKEAVGLLDAEDPTIRPMGGGTALMLMMKAGLFVPSCLVSLRRVEPGFRSIEVGSDGSITIGALAPLRALELSEEIATLVPVIPGVMKTLSNVRVRNVATVGGCLAHADPHMDLPPVMTALGATVTAIGPGGERDIPVENLYEGYYESVLAPNELIATLSIPAQGVTRSAYVKLTTRSADDWPAIGVAVALKAEGDNVTSARIVVSAATEKPVRLAGAETVLLGKVTDTLLKRAGDAAADEALLISDPQGSAAYKRQLLRVAVGRAVRRALGEEDC